MIEKMKKCYFFVESSKKSASLQILKNSGVVHLEHLYSQSVNLDKLKKDKGVTQNSIRILSQLDKKSSKIEIKKFNNLDDTVSLTYKIFEYSNKIDALQEDIIKYKNFISDLEILGDFSPKDLEKLSSQGIDLSIFNLTKKEFKKIDKSLNYFILGKNKVFYIVAFLNAQQVTFNYTKAEIPEYSISEYKKFIADNESEIVNLKNELKSFYKFLGNLKYLQIYLDDLIEFENYKEGMHGDDINYLIGYVPVSSTKNIIEACKDGSIGVVLDDPSEEDMVPTKLKNNKIVSLIEPVFNFLDITPGYREFDISFFFLIFFSIFFAMIIGDGGYGFVFLTVTTIMMILAKVKGKKLNKAHILFGWLSLCTIFWGAITGTWFGSKAIAELPFFKQFVIPQIYSFNPNDRESVGTIQTICFCIGVVHLSIAHIWKFFAEVKSKIGLQALAQLGWISLCWGLFNLVLNMVVSKEKFPVLDISMYAIYFGIAFIMIFSNQEKGQNFFKGILKSFTGIISIVLSWISMFADLISYIRLFAVGLASVKIAEAFNQMGSGSDTIVGIILGAVVILFGHSLNIAMAALSVIVHGVRLKMLEFSSHLGLEWSGEKYKPFAKNDSLN